MWNIFKTDKTFLMVKHDGKLHQVPTEVEYAWDYDDSDPDFGYGNEAEDLKERERFASGKLLNLTLRVIVRALGEEAEDYLGQCFVGSKSIEQDLTDIAISNDMKNEACIRLFIKLQMKLLRQ